MQRVLILDQLGRARFLFQQNLSDSLLTTIELDK